MKEIYVDSVRVAGRYRRDLGDLDSLAKSIKELGLIHPITITENGELIAGQRRLEAFRLLGRDTIPARVVSDLMDAVERLRTERDENTERKEMSISERVALAKALEALEAPRAAQRQHEARVRAGKIRQGQPIPASCSQEQDAGNARDIAARAVDMAPTTYYKARKVVDAAEDPMLPTEEREAARVALADMDTTGNIAGNYEKVRNQRDARLGERRKPTLEKAAAQRKAIGNGLVSLSGIAYGLKQIETLHPDITSAEAAQWVDGLSDARQVITVLINRLKERSNAQA